MLLNLISSRFRLLIPRGLSCFYTFNNSRCVAHDYRSKLNCECSHVRLQEIRDVEVELIQRRDLFEENTCSRYPGGMRPALRFFVLKNAPQKFFTDFKPKNMYVLQHNHSEKVYRQTIIGYYNRRIYKKKTRNFSSSEIPKKSHNYFISV